MKLQEKITAVNFETIINFIIRENKKGNKVSIINTGWNGYPTISSKKLGENENWDLKDLIYIDKKFYQSNKKLIRTLVNEWGNKAWPN